MEIELKYKKRTKDLIRMLGLNEMIVQLEMVNSVPWYGHMKMR